MINLKGFSGFSIEISDSSSEANKLILYSILNNIKVKKYRRDEIPNRKYVPCGSVEYVEKILGFRPEPDYYPDFLKHKRLRKIWNSVEWIRGKRLFVKPADRFKRFDGFITSGTYSKKKKGPFIYSDIVYFQNEWRYYISNGINFGGFWYFGEDEDLKAPELDFEIPQNFTGTIDLGTINNKLALVECHPPYACGWYGSQENIQIYLQWIIDGWEYML